MSTPPGFSEWLVRAAQRDEPQALNQLLAELSRRLGPVCGSIALDDGDDALQETMIMIMRKLRDLEHPAAIGSWARQIAVHEAIRVSRRRQRLTPVVADETLARFSEHLPDVGLGVDVRATLLKLPPEHRAVLVLRHLEGLSEQETARLLGVAPGTVKSRSSRAREAFARMWAR
ncbi:MAG: RNA polymerase sigma factor [Acidimicrobiales bacterium]